MVKEEAIRLIKRKYPDRAIEQVTETKKYFLVSVVAGIDSDPEALVLSPDDDGLKAVDKNTKQIFTYNPIRDGE